MTGLRKEASVTYDSWNLWHLSRVKCATIYLNTYHSALSYWVFPTLLHNSSEAVPFGECAICEIWQCFSQIICNWPDMSPDTKSEILHVLNWLQKFSAQLCFMLVYTSPSNGKLYNSSGELCILCVLYSTLNFWNVKMCPDNFVRLSGVTLSHTARNSRLCV